MAAPSPQAASPSRQTHVLNPLASQPRLTRGALAVPSQLVSGRVAAGLAALCAVWSDEAAPRSLTRLHGPDMSAGWVVSYTAPRARARRCVGP